ncbi:MAG: M23 family metallopeptidase [bacterium]
MNKKYTFMIIPDFSANMHRFHIPKYIVRFLFLILVAIIGCGIFMTYNYFQMREQVQEFAKIKEKNREQESYIISFSKSIECLKRQMVDLQNSNTKLQILAGLQKPENNQQVFGIGGETESGICRFYREDLDKLVDQMRIDLEKLNIETVSQEDNLMELSYIMENSKSILDSTPSIFPTQGWITSGFGYRKSPFTGKRELHKGIDVAGRRGTPIVAPARGIVTYSGLNGGYGNVVEIKHGYGFSTLFAHASVNLVKVGDRIERGDVVALLGNTGRSTAPHLHYEIKINNVNIDPLNYILDLD